MYLRGMRAVIVVVGVLAAVPSDLRTGDVQILLPVERGGILP